MSLGQYSATSQISEPPNQGMLRTLHFRNGLNVGEDMPVRSETPAPQGAGKNQVPFSTLLLLVSYLDKAFICAM